MEIKEVDKIPIKDIRRHKLPQDMLDIIDECIKTKSIFEISDIETLKELRGLTYAIFYHIKKYNLPLKVLKRRPYLYIKYEN